MFEISTVNAREITNKKLNTITNSIIKCAENVSLQCYKIANNLFKVKEEKLYEQDGFKDVVDYANTMFGFKKSTVYSLLKTRQKFIEQGTDHSIFYDEENRRDFTYTQLEPLTKLETEEAERIIEENGINYNTSVREIKRIVKEVTAEEPTEIEPTEIEPTEIEPTEIEPTEIEPTEIEPTEIEPTEIEPTEIEPTVEYMDNPIDRIAMIMKIAESAIKSATGYDYGSLIKALQEIVELCV